MNDTGIAGVIARPPLLLLAALLLGLAPDRPLPWPFAVPGTDSVYWMSAGARADSSPESHNEEPVDA